MKYRIVLLIIVLGLLMATGAQAGLDASFWGTGTQGGLPGDHMDFMGALTNTSPTDDLYINSWSVDTDFSASGITFDTTGSWWKTPYAYGTGTPLIPGTGFNGRLFAAHTDSGLTPTGMYSANFVLSGGIDSAASDVLATLPFTLDVISDYEGFTNTLLNPVQTGGPGYTATYAHSYDNPGKQTILVDTQWVSFHTNTTNIDFNFLYGWPSQVDSGQSIDGNIFSLKINSGAMVQMDYGYSAMVGGYHPGDAHEFITDQWQLNVTDVPAVPEPSALAGLLTGLGGLGTLVARRKRS